MVPGFGEGVAFVSDACGIKDLGINLFVGREVVGIDNQHGDSGALATIDVAVAVVHTHGKTQFHGFGKIVISMEVVNQRRVAADEVCASDGCVGIDFDLVVLRGEDVGEAIATGHSGCHVSGQTVASDAKQVFPLV